MSQNNRSSGDLAEDRTDYAEDRTEWAEDRTVLANERTFAGWMRTGLASVGIGLAVEAIFKEAQPTWLAKSAATVFILIGIFIFIAALRNASKTLSRLNSHASDPVSDGKLKYIVLFFVFGSAFLGIILWLI